MAKRKIGGCLMGFCVVGVMGVYVQHHHPMSGGDECVWISIIPGSLSHERCGKNEDAFLALIGRYTEISGIWTSECGACDHGQATSQVPVTDHSPHRQSSGVRTSIGVFPRHFVIPGWQRAQCLTFKYNACNTLQ